VYASVTEFASAPETPVSPPAATKRYLVKVAVPVGPVGPVPPVLPVTPVGPVGPVFPVGPSLALAASTQ
jgi:hypothetical protein